MLWALFSLGALNACGGGEDLDDDGYEVGQDCEDRNNDVHPGAAEVCDGIDNDCDGNTDGAWAEDATDWYIDYDEDGYGSVAYALRDCERPVGWVSSADDCDDADPTIHPGADELCDFEDNDCNSAVDDGAADATTWYMDADRDGHGTPQVTMASCTQPSGYAARATDCDDEDPDVNVAGTETCDDRDEDCDGVADEGATDAATWYADADGDGYGNPETYEVACEAPDGLVAAGTDCDDAAPDISPAELEICEDGKDNDCDDSDNGCAPNGIWSFETADVSFQGVSSYDNAGAAVASAGDLDGDGLDELLIGSPGSDSRVEGGGVVAVFSGALEATEDLENPAFLLIGVQEGDSAGSALAPGGDVDGDGYAELLVGAPGADTSAEGAGIAYRVSGPLTASLRLSAADVRLKGYNSGDAVGQSLASAGDVDDDGTMDLVVGVPGRDDEGSGAGAAFVVSGLVDGAEDIEEIGHGLLGYGDGATAGRSVAGVGDVDGDGTPDLLIGAPGDEAGGSWAGAAYLVLGPITASMLLPHEGIALRGEEEGDAAGWSVAGLGDMDGDGTADLAVGAYGADGDATDSGKVYVVSGPPTSIDDLSDADAVLRGRETRGYAGWSVAGPGDINGDGATDLLIGARGSDGLATDGGAACLIYGPVTASTGLDAADAIYYGPGAGDLAGSSVAGAGDVDGDGYMDAIMGGPAADGAETSSGGAWLILGSGM